MSDQTLTSLAILTVNWDRGHDVIESFVPLVAAGLSHDAGQPVSLVELQQALADEAGIKIPSGALQAMLGRCARAGLVRREAGVYFPNVVALAAVDFGQAQSEALRKHNCLLKKLRDFAAQRYELAWSDEETNRYILNFLQENSLPVLLAAIEGDPLPPFRPGSQKSRHVISAFALHLHESDPEGFDCLETAVKGHILSGVLFYPDIGQVEARFTDLNVYCDTPVILPALGYADEGVTAQCLDLLELLNELGAGLRCFHHTREEVVGVLEAIAASKRPGGYQIQEPHFFETSRSISLGDVEEMIVKIDDTLAQLGIDVVDIPSFEEKPDEAMLEELLDKNIHYTRERAREKDAQSLAAVARLRAMRTMERFETAKAIFVTRNHALVGVSGRFFKGIEPGGGIPICMSDSLMTRLAWVKRPMLAPDLPRHVVMAASYAALNPRDELWRLYIRELDRRKSKGDISDAEYHLLRSSREARVALLDETFGEEQAFSAGTVDEVLAHAAGTIRGEAEAEAAVARADAHNALERARQERGRRERVEAAHQSQVDQRARKIGWLVSGTGMGIIGIAVVVGLLATIPEVHLVEVTQLSLRVAIWCCIGVFVAITLYAMLVKHMSVLVMGRLIADRVERGVKAKGRVRLAKLHGEALSEQHELSKDAASDDAQKTVETNRKSGDTET